MLNREIKMVDLHGQYMKIKAEIDHSIEKVISDTAFIKGPQVKEFEEGLANYLRVPGVVSCGNGTDALQIALMSLDLKAGDEIITTPFTFIATLEVIGLLGLKPVLVDILPDTFNIDPEKIGNTITKNTRAILPVHLFGQCCDMESILDLANANNLFVIEDAAQALGAAYTFSDTKTKKAGTMGTIGCTSFFPSKNLGAFGDGGAIFTNDTELKQKIAAITNHGMITRYYYDYIGVNSRLDTLQAALLNVKLKYLDEYNKARQEAAAVYNHSFAGHNELILPSSMDNSSHIYHQYTLRIPGGKRDELQKHLASKNIPSMIYYPVGLHLQNAYRDLGYKEGDFPVTEEICKEVLSLPMHTELDNEQLNYITENVLQFFN